jgi:hypothetical protein
MHTPAHSAYAHSLVGTLARPIVTHDDDNDGRNDGDGADERHDEELHSREGERRR